MRLATAAFLLGAVGIWPAQAAGIALVLAVDVSESVSSERYVLQHEGIARAFEAPQLIKAIAEQPGGIEGPMSCQHSAVSKTCRQEASF